MKKQLFASAVLLLTANISFSQVFINEVSTNTDEIEVFGQTCDWIELYNPSSGWAYMHGFSISDDPDNPQKWQFPDNYKIEPYGFLMVLCNDEATGANTNFKLSAKGETIILSDKDGNIVDQVIVPQLLEDQTYGRVQDGSYIWGVFKEATPYASNNSSEAFTTPPTVDIEGGFYNGNQSVTVTCTDPDAEILYSTNGCEPFSKASSNPAIFTIDKNTVLRVCANNPELKKSRAITNTYFINHRECDLPVVVLSTDPQNFYNSTRGIYVQGSAGIAGNCVDFPANWNQDWERPVHFEYFDKKHKKQVSVDAGVKIFGNCSRANAMKSLRIVARQKEYGHKRIEYKIFENKDINKFKSIVLRNGGNDFDYTMLRDGIITQLCAQHMDVDVQAFQPASVYLNGEYLGLHNIREKISEHYIDENYGLEDEDIDLLENNAQIIEGSDKSYKDLIYYAEKNSLKDDNNFKYISDRIDVNNYTDYIIAQLFIDNEDWPNNNIKYWKTNGKNSKWRWILFGTEYSLGLYGKSASDNSIKRVLVDKDNALGNSAWSSVLMKSMLQNEKYRNMFLQRFAYHIQKTFSADNFNQMADSLLNLIIKEWQYHSDKYYQQNGPSKLQSSVSSLKSWMNSRRSYIWEHLKGVFEIESLINIETKSNNASARILLNGYNSKENISGQYFAGIELNLTPDIPAGYTFDKWLVTDNESTKEYNTQTLTINPNKSLEITLVTKEAQPTEIQQSRNTSAKGLVISEVCPKNGGVIADEYNQYPAWIEIRNMSNSAIDLAGLVISNGKENYTIPYNYPETNLEQGRYLVIFADGNSDKGIFHTNFKLKNGGTIELIQVLNGKKEVIDQLKYPKLSKNQSYGAESDNYGTKNVIYEKATPYLTNNGKTIAEKQTYIVPSENIATSTSKVPFTSTVSVYPNPAKNFAVIKGTSENVKWTLITLSGTTIKSGNGTEVKLDSLKSGYYILRINDDNKINVVHFLKI